MITDNLIHDDNKGTYNNNKNNNNNKNIMIIQVMKTKFWHIIRWDILTSSQFSNA